MVRGKQVRIIKRAERKDSQSDASINRSGSRRDVSKAAKRDAITVVTSWVSELRDKKAEEAEHALEVLFGKAA